MSEFMTKDERECLLDVAGIESGDGLAEKALRIIDQQAEELAAAKALLADAAVAIPAIVDGGLFLATYAQQTVLNASAALDLRIHPTGLVTCYGGSRAVELAEAALRGMK